MAPVPDGMPVLSRGKHKHPGKGACFMEYTALLAGEPFSDAPVCVDRELAAVIRHANDTLSDADRPRLLPLLGRSIGLVVPRPAPPPGDVTADVVAATVTSIAGTIAELHQRVASRLLTAIGTDLTQPESRRFDEGRDVDALFWFLMDRPAPLRTSAAWVERLVDRLALLHECYEAALVELRLRAPAPAASCGTPAVVRTAP